MGGAGLAFIGTYLFAMPAIIACSFSFCQDAPLAVYRKSQEAYTPENTIWHDGDVLFFLQPDPESMRNYKLY
jgi:hypothetical protein